MEQAGATASFHEGEQFQILSSPWPQEQEPYRGVQRSCLAPRAPQTAKSKIHTNVYSVPAQGGGCREPVGEGGALWKTSRDPWGIQKARPRGYLGSLRSWGQVGLGVGESWKLPPSRQAQPPGAKGRHPGPQGWILGPQTPDLGLAHAHLVPQQTGSTRARILPQETGTVQVNRFKLKINKNNNIK